jgi:hypothetical protein
LFGASHPHANATAIAIATMAMKIRAPVLPANQSVSGAADARAYAGVCAMFRRGP